ncbi:glycosyltransferase family 4 protein [Acidocella sp.]|uniref:glycosyltransferase family 4 protein n=1 Tax=Acidocella sp. TaxID=50710 RepID=UPI003CFDD2C8
MKIALFVHCFFPDHFFGTETYTLQVAKSLLARGHDVTVVTGGFQYEPRYRAMLTRYVYDGVPVIVFDKNFLPHGSVAETYWQENTRPVLRQILDELRPDIVHVTHLVNHTAVLAGEAKAAGYPLVATLTDFFGFCYTSTLQAADGGLCKGPNMLRTNCIACYDKATGNWPRFQYKLSILAERLYYAWRRRRDERHMYPIGDLVKRPGILRKAYKHYDAMITPTQFLYDAYARNGFDSRRFVLSRFGVEMDRREKPPVNPEAPLTIGYIGQLAAHKGVDLLMNAARTLKPGSFKLKIYGPLDQSPYAMKLRGLATQDMEFCGTFLPAEFRAILDGLDILVIPSTWYENSPLVLLNALASHTPVVVSNVQGMMEFLDGNNGWSFERGDEGELGQLLRRLVEDPAKTRAHSQTTNYTRTIDVMVDEVVDTYAKVLAGSAKANR